MSLSGARPEAVGHLPTARRSHFDSLSQFGTAHTIAVGLECGGERGLRRRFATDETHARQAWRR